MMWTKQNIFEPSGCLSREAFEAFRKDELSPDVKAAANEHFASCPFCADALEGFESIVPEQEMAKVMANTDILFKEKLLLQDKRATGKRILWISFSAAATILLLLGLFILFRNNHPQTQLAQNFVPSINTVTPSEIPKLNKIEPKTSTPPIITKNKIQVDKKNTGSSIASGQSSKPLPNSEVTSTEQTETKSLVEGETQKKDVYATAGQPVAIADTSSVEQVKLTMKSIAYNVSEESNSKRELAAPPAAYSARRSASHKKEGIALANHEALEKKDAATEQDRVFVVVEEPATFQGGNINKFREYVVSQFKYSEGVDTSGKVIVQFVINTKGKVTDIKILRGLDPDIDNEIIRILKNSPLWVPGKQAGKPVKQQFVLQINFSKK